MLIIGITVTPAFGENPDDHGAGLDIPRVFHHPKDVFLQGYPQNLDLIVDIPADSIKSVILFLRIDNAPGFLEIPMEFKRERFNYRFVPQDTPADSLEYYFIVNLIDSSIHAAPLDDLDQLIPVKRVFIDPQLYYKNRHLFK